MVANSEFLFVRGYAALHDWWHGTREKVRISWPEFSSFTKAVTYNECMREVCEIARESLCRNAEEKKSL